MAGLANIAHIVYLLGMEYRATRDANAALEAGHLDITLFDTYPAAAADIEGRVGACGLGGFAGTSIRDSVWKPSPGLTRAIPCSLF